MDVSNRWPLRALYMQMQSPHFFQFITELTFRICVKRDSLTIGRNKMITHKGIKKKRWVNKVYYYIAKDTKEIRNDETQVSVFAIRS